MLILPIKKKWFDMIASGEKKEEYREIKPYWNKRFGNVFGRRIYDCYRDEFVVDNSEPDEFLGYMKPQIILLRNGYGSNKPTIKCLVNIIIGQGKPEWGAEPGKEYYILEILEIHEVQIEIHFDEVPL